MIGICYKYTENPDHRDPWMMLLQSMDIIGYERGLDKSEPIQKNQRIVGISSNDELPKDVPIVVITPADGREVKSTKSLVEFEHPDDVIYYVGPDDWCLTSKELEGINIIDYVYIPIDSHIWSFQAGSIVLYDRISKNNK